MTETHMVRYGPCLLVGDSPDPVWHRATLRLLSQAFQVPLAARHVRRVFAFQHPDTGAYLLRTTRN